MKRKNQEERRRGGAGRNQGRRAEDGVQGLQRLNVTLDLASVERLRQLGDGNVSLGIRKAIAIANSENGSN